MTGPYESESEALAGPVYKEVRALHEAGRVRPYDPDRLVHSTQLRALEAACAEAGVELGAFDRRIVSWLAGWEASTVEVVIGLITRANRTETTE